MRRVAVVGAGIAGLGAAWLLERQGIARPTLFESDRRAGGHAHTVDVSLPDASGVTVTAGVDTGFLVFNQRTYPQFCRLLDQLGVDTAASDMSFSVQVATADLEWSGSDLGGVFAQRRNLVRPAFWRMLNQLLRFNRLTTELARSGDANALDESIGDFLDRHGFGREFRDWYFLPMVACIWSCPTEQMLAFPMATMIRFCHNHGLLQIADRPAWKTIRGGSRHYVDRMVAGIGDVRRGRPVLAVRRDAVGVDVVTEAGPERFDEVVFACHADQALALLGEGARPDERAALGAIRFQDNRAVLHTDDRLLPRRRTAWSAWNYEHAATTGAQGPSVCLHYLINRLQPLPFSQPVVVTLNPIREPRAGTVLGEFRYAHPIFDRAALQAQQRLPSFQGRLHSWFCGAWMGYGFHEDGLASAARAVSGLETVLVSGRDAVSWVRAA